jgi:hypothetical protein
LKGKTMLIHPLAERLRGLGMAVADAFLEMQTTAAAAELSREDRLGLLIDCEATARDNKGASNNSGVRPFETRYAPWPGSVE